jgi:hypothetical protein
MIDKQIPSLTFNRDIADHMKISHSEIYNKEPCYLRETIKHKYCNVEVKTCQNTWKGRLDGLFVQKNSLLEARLRNILKMSMMRKLPKFYRKWRQTLH